MINFELTMIDKVKGGDINAFGSLIERYEKRIFVFVSNMTNNWSGVEDLVQEIFFSAYKNIATFDPHRGSFSNWLYRIAKNLCINELKRKKEILMDCNCVSPDVADPTEDLLRRETLRRLDHALYQLSHKDRELFILAELEGLSYEELAEVEQIRIGTVKSRLSRIREKLKKVLKNI